MKLIADSGSSKTDWCLFDANQTLFFKTQGINPFFVNEQQIVAIIKNELLPQMHTQQTIQQIIFYGAGCVGDKMEVVKLVLQKCFLIEKIEVQTDLLAAARATAGNKKGLIVIAGTGSNTGLYDGEKFIQQIPSLGFLLGDEASGSWLGKKILADYFRNDLPQNIFETVKEVTQQKSFAEFISQVYLQQNQGKYLAQFATILKQHQQEDYSKTLVSKGFEALFQNIICYYPNYKSYPLNAVGSIAFHFKTELKTVAHKYEMQLGSVIQSPIEALKIFHQ